MNDRRSASSDTRLRPPERFDATDEMPQHDPRPMLRFDADTDSQPLDETLPDGVESALDRALARPRKRRWGLLVLVGGALAVGVAQSAMQLVDAWRLGEWLAGAWGALGVLGGWLLAGALGRELGKLRRLRRHSQLRQALIDESPEPFALCDRLRRQMGLADDDPHWRAFTLAHQQHHSDAETRTLFAHHVLAPRDRKARGLITRMASESALMVAVSPSTLLDMGLIAWRNLYMIDRLARLYGLELGYASRLKLFRTVLANMAFAGTSEFIADAGMDMLSMNLLERLSARAAQGMGSGLLTARLGLRTIRLLRPLPFEENQAPRLADLRRELWTQLKRLDRDGRATRDGNDG
ncbi:YcjF family protein [Halotalea alkalilenta]|uniref:TIGR01620 family protein n=1 Tax=Halotalea alkalilenta TaxID=376489 RepID=A0A172YGU9_9GAMM|nr:TIGR01620 family protein [Halotalea alkalilenta]ANF58434.1 hypothetical protein A5892_13945 [Halotalea alkalilenta]